MSSQRTFMVGQDVGERHPRLLGLQVGGARGVQVKTGTGPHLSVGVKGQGSGRCLKQTSEDVLNTSIPSEI